VVPKRRFQTTLRHVITQTTEEFEKCSNSIDFLKRDFQVTASWRIRRILDVSALNSMQALQKTDFWGPIFFYRIWLRLFSTKRPSRAVARGGTADEGRCTTAFCFYSLGVLKQHQCTGQSGPTAWPWFNFIRLLSVGTPEVSCLCHSS
jgi:hypothetical protein